VGIARGQSTAQAEAYLIETHPRIKDLHVWASKRKGTGDGSCANPGALPILEAADWAEGEHSFPLNQAGSKGR
jgi:hypothetical protein